MSPLSRRTAMQIHAQTVLSHGPGTVPSSGRSFAARIKRWLPTGDERPAHPVEHQGSWLVVTPTGGQELPAGPMRIILPSAEAPG